MAKRSCKETSNAETFQDNSVVDMNPRRDAKMIVSYRKKKRPPAVPPVTHNNNRSWNALPQGHTGPISAISGNESQLGSPHRSKRQTKIPRYGQRIQQLKIAESFSDVGSLGEYGSLGESDSDWDLLSFETSSVTQDLTQDLTQEDLTQISTSESSFRGQASTWEQESFVARGSISQYVSNIRKSVSEMEHFLQRGDSQANLLTGYDDDDDLDNELRDLADVEKELRDEMAEFLRFSENDADSSTGRAEAFSIYLERDNRSGSFDDSDLDDSYHGVKIPQRRLEHSDFQMNKENNDSSDSIIRMKIRRNSLSYDDYLNRLEAEDEYRPMALATPSPSLRRRSSSYGDATRKPLNSVATKLFPNLAQSPLRPKAGQTYFHKRRSSDFYLPPSALSHEQKRRLSAILSVGGNDSSDEGSPNESERQRTKKPSTFEFHRAHHDDTTILSPPSIKVLQSLATPIQSNLSDPSSMDDKLAKNLAGDFSRDENNPWIAAEAPANTDHVEKLARNHATSLPPPQSGNENENLMTQEDTMISTTAYSSPLYQQRNDRNDPTTLQGTPDANSPSYKQIEVNSLNQLQEKGSMKTESGRSLESPSTSESELPSLQTERGFEGFEDQDHCAEGTGDTIDKIANRVFCSHEYSIVPFLSGNNEPEEFTRTYEGTFMVYLACWISISFLYGIVPHYIFWTTALIIPLYVALIEINLTHNIDEVTIALGIISFRFVAEKVVVNLT